MVENKKLSFGPVAALRIGVPGRFGFVLADPLSPSRARQMALGLALVIRVAVRADNDVPMPWSVCSVVAGKVVVSAPIAS
jgi:hypothetical protein